MMSAPAPAVQSPPVVSVSELALASASRSVHELLLAVTSSALELTTMVAAEA